MVKGLDTFREASAGHAGRIPKLTCQKASRKICVSS
jgi:hypothetical protein